MNFGGNLYPSTFIKIIKGKLRNISIGSAYIGGKDVEIGEGTTFYDTPLVFGKVKIGRYTSINGPGTRICSNINDVEIKAFCSIASNVIIQEYYHNTALPTTYNILSQVIKDKDAGLQVTSKGKVILEEDVWVGSNACILSGVTIGRGSVIGAGAVVTKDIPPYSVAAGNPCKVIKSRFDQNTIAELEASRWWEWSEDEIKKNAEFFKIARLNNDQ